MISSVVLPRNCGWNITMHIYWRRYFGEQEGGLDQLCVQGSSVKTFV